MEQRATKRALVASSLLRGAALFFGLFSAANAMVVATGANRSEDLWWVDLSFLPSGVGSLVAIMVPVMLVAYAVAPEASRWRRVGTSITCAAVSLSALVNARGFYAAWGAGHIEPGAPLPFSAMIALVFGLMAWGIWVWAPPGSTRRSGKQLAGTAAAALGLVVLFPLAQVVFFGTTDYRRPSDTAVVLGALVYPDGTLSQSLEDRVRTSCELYRQGLVTRLIMSGGVGASGVDEAMAMKARAIAMGVPEESILTDSAGVNTDATVANTAALVRSPGERILVVSQFYHLPRIKMAYRAAGLDVKTVPAPPGRTIAKTPLFVAREIPGFWVYWARAAWRDVTSPRVSRARLLG